MKRFIKSFFTFVIGAIIGLIFGGAGVVAVEFKSDRVRNAMSNVICDFIGKWLYGERGKVSYHSYYTRRRNHNSMFCNASRNDYYYAFDSNAIVFDTYEKAIDARNALFKLCDEYSCITVQDLYDVAGKTNSCHTAVSYGWNDVDVYGTPIQQNENGYFIDLPIPKKIAA